MFPDPNDNIIQLSDRIKELSYTTGTNNMVLEGAAPGFSRFEDFYQQSGLVFYAITDGSNYEVGSGHYLSSGLDPFYSSDQIRRYPFRSTNSNNKIDWAAGTKEVFVTYPAPFTVVTAYGVDDRFKQPQRSGIAFWDNDGVASGTNILNYDSSGNWDKDNHFLGLHTHDPGYAIDIAGPAPYSIIKASGLRLDASGIIFSGVSYATRQVDPFLKNQVDATTGSNAVIDVSGWVNESIVLKKQSAGQIFAGPVNDCGGGCADNYPAFRVLDAIDIPDLSHLYLTGYNLDPQVMSGIPFFHKSGVLTYDPGFVWNDGSNMLGINNVDPKVELDVVGGARISSNLTVGNNLTVSGNLDIAGTTTYIDSTNVTIWDKQIELASMSGNASHDQLDAYINDGGTIVRSSGDGASDTGDKKWTWQNSSNTWKAQTSNGNVIGVTASGMIFGNGTAISGAYQGGSGVSINGFNIDVGNVFTVTGNDNAKYGSSNQQVHQADNVIVSGVSGISTWITKTGSNTTLHIDPGHLSGVLQGEINTAGANRFPYSSGVAISGLINAVSGVGGLLDQKVANSGYHISGILQTQISAMGDTGEVNQNAFSVMAVSGAFHSNGTSDFNISANAKTDTITFVSGDNNAILVSGNGVDIITISGANVFRFGADNQTLAGAFPSGYVAHNDGINFSGGYGITTSGHADSVTISWSGGSNLFTLRGDSDAGAGGSTISSDGPSIIDISGGSYITTTRTNDKVVVAFSGLDNVYDWLTNPGSLSAMTSSAADNADEMLIWDDNVGAWKKFTVAEMSTKFSSGSGGSQNLYHTITVDNTDTEYTWDDTSFTPGGTTESLEFVSRNDDLYLAADATTKSVGFGLHNTGSGIAVAISGQLVESGVLQSGILQTQITAKAHGVDLTQASGTLDARITSSGVAVSGFCVDHLDKRITSSGVAVSGFLLDHLSKNITQVSGTLDQRISNSGVAVSGHVMTYNGSGVDIYTHASPTKTRTINLNEHWLKKSPKPGATIDALSSAFENMAIGYKSLANPKTASHGSIHLGTFAGSGQAACNPESHLNFVAGYKAGWNMGNARHIQNVYIGNEAGARADSLIASYIDTANICIGSKAGYQRNQNSTGNIFLGSFAGSTAGTSWAQGDYNISIGHFNSTYNDLSSGAGTSDASYQLNIANTIFADTDPSVRKVKIGKKAESGEVAPLAQLEVVPMSTTITGFHIARESNQSSSLFTTETAGASYNGAGGNTRNIVVNSAGYLRIPIFTSRSELNAISASDHPGMIALYDTGRSGATNKYLMVFSDGIRWKKAGDVQNDNLPQS